MWLRCTESDNFKNAPAKQDKASTRAHARSGLFKHIQTYEKKEFFQQECATGQDGGNFRVKYTIGTA